MRFRVEVATVNQLVEAASLGQPEYVYTSSSLLTPEVSNKIEDKARIIVLPPIFTCGKLCGLRNLGFSRVLAHTIGHIPVIHEAGMTGHGGFRLNITNSAALKEYASLGLADTIMSIEVSLQRLGSLSRSFPPFPIGVYAYGRLPMMLLKRSPNVGDSDGFTDRKGKFIRIVNHGNNQNEYELLNPDVLCLSDRVSDLEQAKLDFVVLKLSPGESVKQILEMFENGIKPENNSKLRHTKGLYY
ncbi:MAG: hypothetical protein FWG83_00995 [Oscillospiraceae bacterium]|nr:hypothetical protein [Oscillospiraceae bacterium]